MGLILSRFVFNFLARVQDKITNSLITQLTDEEYGWIQTKDPHSLTNALFAGVSAFSINALGQVILIIGEASLLFVLLIIFVYLNLILTLCMLFYIGVILYVLNYSVGKRITEYNTIMLTKRIGAQLAIFSILSLFKEIRLGGTADFFIKKTTEQTEDHSKNLAKDIWIQQLPKYVMEFAMLVGIGIVAVIASTLGNRSDSVGLLAIFIASALRIFPSMLRVQGSIFSIRAAQPQAKSAWNLISEMKLRQLHPLVNTSNIGEFRVKAFLEFRDVFFSFPNSREPTLKGINLKIHQGNKIGVVGPSGSGKSTLADLMQGLIAPTEGSALINGIDASIWTSTNPGKVAYIPQIPTIIDGSILENVTIGRSLAAESFLRSIFLDSGIYDFVEALPEKANTIIGTHGYKLSGGQSQRLAIARALYSNPQIIVFDEATAALDAQTEESILKMILNLPSSVTVIFIAHRLSSLKYLHKILYLADGEIRAVGSMDEVRTKVVDFDKQLKLMGL